jgi:hypothetical protein
LPSEKNCSNISVKAHSGPWYWPQFEVKLLLPGPFKGVLGLKKENKPYTLERFRAWGVVKAKTTGTFLWMPINIILLTAYYLGRSGVEVELAKWTTPSPEATLDIDKYLDVYREWRGLGIQGIRVFGRTSWETDVELNVSICFELTWVG